MSDKCEIQLIRLHKKANFARHLMTRRVKSDITASSVCAVLMLLVDCLDWVTV